MKKSDPFDLLLDMEQRTQARASSLPSLDKVEDEWVGVGFRIGDSKLMATMSDVKEILDLPDFTMVPGVQSWIVGVANVRGSLLPIVDMRGFLLGDDIKQRNKGRVIVISYKGFDTGLVVEEVYGMRHFRVGDTTEDIPAVDEKLSPYIEKAFKQEDEHWPVFSFDYLAQDERFAHVSL